MYIRLQADGVTATIYGSGREFLEKATTESGKVVHIYRSVSPKIGEFKLWNEISDELLQAHPKHKNMICAWKERQEQRIAKAYTLYQAEGLFGGVPVILHDNKERKNLASRLGYNAECKIGEFSGVIKGAMPINLRQFDQVEAKTPEQVAENLWRCLRDLLNHVAEQKDKTPATALTDEQARELYKVLRVTFLTLNRGLKINLGVCKDQFVEDFEQLRKEHPAGKIFGSSRRIGELFP